jgi:hypothetical protein
MFWQANLHTVAWQRRSALRLVTPHNYCDITKPLKIVQMWCASEKGCGSHPMTPPSLKLK